MSARLDFEAWLLEHEGAPYLWGAKGRRVLAHGRARACFDCSGLVTAGMVAVGYPAVCPRCGEDWRLMHGAAALWEHLEPTASPRRMDLCFYGREAVSHVMVYWGEGRVYGACGGSSSSTDAERSLTRRAVVRFQERVYYRPDVRGFRRLPLE